MGAILNKRKDKREGVRETDTEEGLEGRGSIRLGEQNQAAYFISALTLS